MPKMVDFAVLEVCQNPMYLKITYMVISRNRAKNVKNVVFSVLPLNGGFDPFGRFGRSKIDLKREVPFFTF